jgi:hypothetical protein
MVFFPAAAFTNAPKYNKTVVDFTYRSFLSEKHKNYKAGAFLEMTVMDKKTLNHTVQFWNYFDHHNLRSFLFVNFTT